MNPEFVTVYTDASHCPNTKVGGWGAWMKYNGKSMERSGGIDRIANPELAEFKAAVAGLYYARQALDRVKPGLRIIVLVTDCKNVQNAINRLVAGEEQKKSNEYLDWVLEFINELPEDSKLRVKKVKAHSNKDGKRSWVNNRVDKLAKAEMRTLRDAAKP